MKVFLVFCGLLLVGVWMMCYQGDMGRFIRAQTMLKAVSEECAAGAALALDGEAFAEGRIEFDRELGQAYADRYVSHTIDRLRGITVRGYTCSLSYENQAVTARITLAVEDLFSLPLLSVESLTRESRYELKDFGVRSNME